MTAYALKSMTLTTQLIALLMLVIINLVISSVLIDQFFSGYQAFLLTWSGMGLCLLISTIYIFVRNKLLHE